MQFFLAMSLLQKVLNVKIVIETYQFNATYIKMSQNAYDSNRINFLAKRIVSFIAEQIRIDSEYGVNARQRPLKDFYHFIISGFNIRGKRNLMPKRIVYFVFGEISLKASSFGLLSFYTGTKYRDRLDGPGKHISIANFVLTPTIKISKGLQSGYPKDISNWADKIRKIFRPSKTTHSASLRRSLIFSNCNLFIAGIPPIGSVSTSIKSIGIVKSYLVILKHSKPEEIKGEYAKQLDFPTWLAYGTTLMSLTASMLLIRMVHGLYKYADISDIVLRFTAGIVNPNSLDWFTNISSSTIIVNMWSILALSFFTFYLIEFRSFIIGQKFPKEITHISEIDFVQSGFFFDNDLFNSQSEILNPSFEQGNYGLFEILVSYSRMGYIGDILLQWKSKNDVCPEDKLVSIDIELDFQIRKQYDSKSIKQHFCPYFEKTAAVITSRYLIFTCSAMAGHFLITCVVVIVVGKKFKIEA